LLQQQEQQEQQVRLPLVLELPPVQQLPLFCCKRSVQRRPAEKRSRMFFSWEFLHWIINFAMNNYR
jgi:hypothetical protein